MEKLKETKNVGRGFMIVLLGILLSGYLMRYPSSQLYLYGEQHNKALIKEEELRLWKQYYNEGMRHLFIETSYYAAMFLNEWMVSEDDTILDQLMHDWQGTNSGLEINRNFYETIKKECPQTIFHGTDVGHGYRTTGWRYLRHLEEQGKKDSKEYEEAQRCIAQGKRFYSKSDMEYREEKMHENFIRQYDALNNEDIMGIYGLAHIQDCGHLEEGVPYMAQTLEDYYDKNRVHCMDLTEYAYVKEAVEHCEIELDNKKYQADYYGEEKIEEIAGYQSRAFYHLIDAYEDFATLEKSGDCLPLDNFLMKANRYEAYLIVYTMDDGTTQSIVYCTNGNEWEGMEVAEAVK